jgi:cell division protein FtsB
MPSARSATAVSPRARATRRAPARPRRVGTARSSAMRVRWDRVGRVGLLIVFAVVAGLYIQQGLALVSTHSQAVQQLAIVHRLASENRSLERQQRSLKDPATIERDARALGMVRPGERPYVVTGLPSGGH